MDLLTFSGLLVGFAAIFGGYIGEGGDPIWCSGTLSPG